jgi:hypothetical protein
MFMNELVIIDEHLIIRETVGYDFIKDISIEDLPSVLRFLKMVYNYNAICIELIR